MTPVVGHDAAIRAFVDAMASGRMHHAWLLAGAEGVGKATFARAAAARLLADDGGGDGFALPADHPVVPLVEGRSHPDLRWLDRRFGVKEEDEDRRNIPIDAIRALRPLLEQTASLGTRRVVVIDAVDHLERGAANALLKSLEEPPPDLVFLLVSHAPGWLLPTIRSRVRMLRFGPLGDEEMRRVLAAQLSVATPDEIAALVASGAGSPGRALAFAGLDVAGLDRTLAAIAADGDPHHRARLTLARALALKPARARFFAFLDRALAVSGAIARRRRGAALGRALDVIEQIRPIAAAAPVANLDPQATVMRVTGLMASLAGPAGPVKG